MIPLKKLLLILLAFCFILFVFVGCVNETQPIPYPTISIRYEIPPEIIFSIRSVEELKFWLWQNYNYVKDDTWSGIKDYPLTPAEFFRDEIQLTNGAIVSKLPRSGDCEDYASLTAYLLQQLGYKAYIVVIPDCYTKGIAHAISYGIKNNEFVAIDSPWVITKYSSFDEYMEKSHPNKTVSTHTTINVYLDYLYITGHHKYWDEEINDVPKCRGDVCPVGE